MYDEAGMVRLTHRRSALVLETFLVVPGRQSIAHRVASFESHDESRWMAWIRLRSSSTEADSILRVIGGYAMN